MGGPHRPIIISITGQREKVTEREEGGERERERAYAERETRGGREEGRGRGFLDREEHIGDADSRICRPEN